MSRTAPLGSLDAAYPAQRPVPTPQRRVDHALLVQEAEPLDEISALLELAEASTSGGSGLAGQLMDYITPRPRQPDTLQPQRLAPLLGLAMQMLADQAESDGDLARLGASAIEHELRRHQALAERRATPVMDDAA